MVNIQNKQTEVKASGEISNKRFKIIKESGEIEDSKGNFHNYENIVVSWVKFDPTTKEEKFNLIKDQNGKTHRVLDEKTATIPVDLIGEVLKLKN